MKLDELEEIIKKHCENYNALAEREDSNCRIAYMISIADPLFDVEPILTDGVPYVFPTHKEWKIFVNMDMLEKCKIMLLMREYHISDVLEDENENLSKVYNSYNAAQTVCSYLHKKYHFEYESYVEKENMEIIDCGADRWFFK